MSGRLASDDEVTSWREEGWALLHDLIGVDEIDSALVDLWQLFPTPAAFHAEERQEVTSSTSGPATRPEQFKWRAEFPFPGSGRLNRLCVHPALVDFAERALGSSDLRLYQLQANAKYTGDANYEQPLHTDRNHSLLPARMEPPWWHLQVFVYLSDVYEGVAPTRIVSRRDSAGRSIETRYMPEDDPGLYASEVGASGRRGSVLVYRPDVFHRAVDLTEPGGSRFLLNLGFKVAGQEWIGYHAIHSRTGLPNWVQFVEDSTPRELALFGFPAPGHQVWTPNLVEATARRYPRLDLRPWREAVGT